MQSVLIFLNKYQASYFIVDQAEEDCEVVQDPFLEAGITIPSDLPYQDKSAEKDYQKDNIELKIQLDGEKLKFEFIRFFIRFNFIVNPSH